MCVYTPILIFTVNGGWSGWTDVGMCSASCHGGSQLQERSCSNPPPQFDGDDCQGNNTRHVGCNDIECECKYYIIGI